MLGPDLRDCCVRTLWILILLVAGGCGEEPQSDQSQNSIQPKQVAPRAVLLISLDTLRADHLGTYGHERFTSPVLDQFAREGVVFEDASSTAPWTLPAHASMLSGLAPSRNGMLTSQTALPAEIGTLAKWFSDAGWLTSAIVNVLWLKKETYGITRDFEGYTMVQDPDYKRRTPSTWITEEVMQQLADQGDQPLFLFIHYYDIHADYASLEAYERVFVTPYDGQADGSAWELMRYNFHPKHIEHCLREFDPLLCEYGSAEVPRRIDASMERVEYDEDDIRHIEELYDAGIRQTDTEIGRLINHIEELGRTDDTLVLVTSDHGEEFMEHGRVDHRLSVYQESLHVPLLMRGPGVPSGERFDMPVSILDIAPTLLSLAGVATPEGLDGVDLSLLWRDSDRLSLEKRFLFGEASGGLQQAVTLPDVYPIYRSVRRGNLKLVEIWLSGETKFELYDLSRDPDEKTDIGAQEPEILAEFKAKLADRKRGHESAPEGEAVELDLDELEELKALGYIP